MQVSPIDSSLWKFDQEILTEFSSEALSVPFILAGVDEVGRGPLAGNVVAACVILDFKSEPIVGLNDSKKLTAAKREFLFGEIQKRAMAFGVGECTPAEIDKYNILRASLLAMRRALDQMQKFLKDNVKDNAIEKNASIIHLVLVDGNQKIPDLPWPQRTVIQGDGKSASIAAASILAKVIRDRQMDELQIQFPEFGFGKHKGYPTEMHRQAINRLGLTPFHRLSFCRKDNLQIEMFP